MQRTDIRHRWRFFTVLLAFIFLIPRLQAQPTEQTVQNRFLFIFDTSRDMKARLDATQKELNTLLATSLSGQLHAGDSMGVWTFGQVLQTKDYPLQTWHPEAAVMIASNLVRFVGNRAYGKTTRFEVLQPALNTVVQDSERLTVLIFCDGETKFSGTPFDNGINQILDQKRAEQSTAAQPFVIVIRSQLGQFAGCSVNQPPAPINYLQFPPLPAPPTPPPLKPTNSPAPEPVVITQPLIIIGTKPAAKPTPTNAVPATPPAATNPPPTAAEAPANMVGTPAVTNVAGQQGIPTNTAIPATAQTSAPTNTNATSKSFLVIGSGLLGAAIALGIVFWRRPRRTDPSLITRSMNDRK